MPHNLQTSVCVCVCVCVSDWCSGRWRNLSQKDMVEHKCHEEMEIVLWGFHKVGMDHF